ncbi:hypothetical protein L1987_04651 [Smallanthus sonchifolius]|uniref:Uncharacterized protein n=2 Tax=Smallanthus sonchifolius TaxID=185202 RepID=A0ACB9JTH2_9ASTR|nr:hypothetical protein L1987_04647 [Smallanthus sonchifolius]KAI3823218.1 hypothetical protein L1987_04651 [Smallanthus sonchifolius]
METGEAIEDKFSKMHSCFQIDTRIGIIGGGPSGLSAAYTLMQTRIYDLGGQVLAANSAPTIFHLANQIGAETEELDTHKFAIINTSTAKFHDTKLIDDYVSVISLTLKLQDQANATNRIGVHAISDIASDPTPSFLQSNGLKSVPKSVAYGFTASGYGFVQDMPYAYVHEFTRTSMAGKVRRFKGGYTSVWDKISKQLPLKVCCNARVLTVKRNVDGVSVEVKIGDGGSEKHGMEFDKLIISGSFPVNSGKIYRSPLERTEEFVNEAMDLSDLEKEIFSKVETIDYYTTVLKIDGFDHIPVGFYYFGEFMDDPNTIGNPVAMQRFYPDTNIFLFWSYGNSVDIVGEKVTQLAVDAVTRMGGEVKKVTLQRRFKYFPHVNSQEMKDGFYEKLENQLQGQNNTFYVGGLMAFELTERNSSYAFGLVLKHFASDNPEPSFPYVKRLFTMKSDNRSWISRQLNEASRVEFPDISSIDGYLRHWGNHELIANKTLYTWINDKGETISQRTYKELDNNVSYIAHKLLTSKKPVIQPGDRVLLVYIPGLEFIDAFFGCLRARIIPVPAIPPDPSQTGGQPLIHIENIAKRTKAVAILSTFGYHFYVKANSAKNKIMLTGKRKNSGSWPNLQWLHTDSWIKNSKGCHVSFDEVSILVKESWVLPKDLCFLQFTSGSTGDAKGVMLTHSGLIHNVKLMRKVYKSTSNTVAVSWLPQYHDMGLIGGLLTTLVSGGTAILFSPLTFIKNPLLWLQTMRRIKDLIIVGGRNIYASDVEKTVESSSEFIRPGCCAVVGVPEAILLDKGIVIPENSDQTGLVVIAEVKGNKPPPNEIIDRIQTVVAEEHGITIASVVLIKERTICKTTSGKIKRFECLKKFTDNKLQVIEAIQSTTRNTKDTISGQSKQEIIHFLKKLLSDQTGIPTASISVTESLANYGIDSIGVVRAAQKLSGFLGTPVGAIDIFTATCIDELADFAEDLVRKSFPEISSSPSDFLNKKTFFAKIHYKVSSARKFGIWIFHLLGLVYISFLLMIPIYLSVSAYIWLSGLTPFRHTLVISKSSKLIYSSPWFGYLISVTCVPVVWMFYIMSTCITVAIFGNSFLQPNYGLTPDISIWSIDFVKWWTLYKAQEVSSRVHAVHLKGTVFAQLWFEMLGAKIGSSVGLDTVDITDPYLVTIGDGAVVAEGALIQSHEVKNGVLSLQPIRIGENSCVGPYAVLQKGSIVDDGAEVPALQTCKGGQREFKMSKITKVEQGAILKDNKSGWLDPFYHILGIYMVGFLSSLSAAIAYNLYLWLSQKPQSLQHLSFLCLCASVHWLPFNAIAYIIIFKDVPATPLTFSITIAIGYLAHGIILTFLTSILHHILSSVKQENHMVMWFCHRLTTSLHLKFAKFLSGTEAFCVYLRVLGAKIGNHCSIRAINPIIDPELVLVGDGVHLGDFSRIVTGFYNKKGYIRGPVKVEDNSVIGSQELVLPGSVVEPNVILGALSVAPVNSTLRAGGVYVGSQNPIMVKNITHRLDDRIEEMDEKYKKVLGNLAANFAAATFKVKSRYFHRIGAAGKGTLQVYETVPGFPDHKIFSPGKCYPIIIRHSNCLSSDDDARLDPRGAAIRILSDESDSNSNTSILDLTLKTGNAFHARTIGDFATWLVCGAAAREEHLKHAPHIRDAMWGSLRNTDSYAELHYYSNICRLFRFEDGNEMYVKFKLRPFDVTIDEDSGKVEPTGILPPETGAIPRDENDKRPLLFLDDDFKRRVNSREHVRYVLQFQFRPVLNDEVARESVLDCTKPWDEKEFPYVEVGEITIDRLLTNEESDNLEFNPFLKCHEIDVIQATSCSQSASMDHGRSVVYSICQHLRNNKPLPESWRNFLQHSDVKVDLTGCPMATRVEKTDTQNVTLARPWYKNLWMMSGQPLLQVIMPYFLMGMVIFAPLNAVLYLKSRDGSQFSQLHWLIPGFWFGSGVLAGVVCGVAKWVLVGKKKEGETVMIWSTGVYLDTIWQAIRTLVGEYFMDMSSGSVVVALWMNLMGSHVAWNRGAYVDSMGAVLNPEMVTIEPYGSVGREALLFGHIYEGEGGKVKFGKVKVKEAGFVGSRAVAMPGVVVKKDGNLAGLSLAMKEEIIK